MKHISTLALVLAFGAASIYAEQEQVRMTFSGSVTSLAPPINLVSAGNGPLSETAFAGTGSLGPFTSRGVGANTAMPTGFGCAGPNSILFTSVAGAGVYRFEDGSLLTTKTKSGTVCVNLTAGSANDTIIEDITGGTGRFQNASGTLTTTTVGDHPVLFDATGHPIFFVVPNGQITGTIILPDRKED
jgi:hypothetical protein